MHLAGYQHIPGKWRLPTTSQNTLGISHLTAPSAVHLTTCFLPDSQHHRFSVKASLPLSPLQRFEVLNYLLLYSRLPALSIGMYRLLQIFRTLLCEVLNQGFYALLRFWHQLKNSYLSNWLYHINVKKSMAYNFETPIGLFSVIWNLQNTRARLYTPFLGQSLSCINLDGIRQYSLRLIQNESTLIFLCFFACYRHFYLYMAL